MAYINGKEILFSPTVNLTDNATISALIDRSITEIEIPLSVTSIGRNAFAYCVNLKTVTMHDNIKTLGNSSFQNCTKLEELKIPFGVVDIPNNCVMSCTNLKNVTIPNTVKTIGSQAFLSCNSLKEITLPNSIESIPTSSALPTKLETVYCDWAEGEKPTVEANAPWGASSAEIVYLRRGNTNGLQFALNSEGTAYTVTGYTGTETDIYISNTYNGKPVTEIGNNAFDPQVGNTVGITKVEIAEGITKIGDYAFVVCNSLNTVILPSTLESIGTNAFDSCGSLTSIEIPDNVVSVGDYAFTSCGLRTARLGNGCLWNMGNEVFAGCNYLTNIYVPWSDGNNDGAPWGATNAEILYDSM